MFIVYSVWNEKEYYSIEANEEIDDILANDFENFDLRLEIYGKIELNWETNQ